MSTAAPVIHIVDDDMSVRTAVGRVLRAAGYQVSLYESASHLLDHLPAAERGCILLDVRMPGLNGPQLQEVLRVRPKTSARVTKLSQHEANGGEFQEREGVAVEIFPILGEAAATIEPRNRTFDDPALG